HFTPGRSSSEVSHEQRTRIYAQGAMSPSSWPIRRSATSRPRPRTWTTSSWATRPWSAPASSPSAGSVAPCRGPTCPSLCARQGRDRLGDEAVEFLGAEVFEEDRDRGVLGRAGGLLPDPGLALGGMTLDRLQLAPSDLQLVRDLGQELIPVLDPRPDVARGVL